ncbi:DUF732 domain-containing protein [Amycolatopsis sp. CA-161197]|uniref:DUF732 domain-containing protein n=1 Tax=Amycolatopsis sp. CA-161197 TaxID=3239922 RepID=UPI003D8E1D5D
MDPGLVTNEARAVVHAHDLCDDLARGKDHAAVPASATWYFNGADGSVDQAKAEQIVAAAGSLC